MPHPAPARALLDRPQDPTHGIAALYPHDAVGAQQLLADTAAALLRDTGGRVRVGRYGEHATVEVLAGHGAVVLVPMADLTDLDAELAVEDDRDPAVWQVLARGADGALLEPALGAHACPSVLWAVRAGIDPGAAVALVDAALADAQVRALLGQDARP